jgi:hypothetical protein
MRFNSSWEAQLMGMHGIHKFKPSTHKINTSHHNSPSRVNRRAQPYSQTCLQQDAMSYHEMLLLDDCQLLFPCFQASWHSGGIYAKL